MSARTILVLSLTGILLLDVARSFHARSAFTEPAPLQNEATAAQPIAWPPGSDLAADASLGKRVYARHCAVCHGPDGKGNGPAAPGLRPRPRDFSGGIFKFKSSNSSQPPRLDDLRRTIRTGLAGTSMPAWKDLLSDEEVDAVAELIRQFGPITAWAEESAGKPPEHILESARAERGKEQFGVLGCLACHGIEGHGDGPSGSDLRDVWKQHVAARDLTAPWTYRWGTERAVVYRVIAGGLNGTPMPGYLEVATPQDIADVVAYLESIARRPPWEGGDTPPSRETSVERGEYLVRTGMCGLCHTPVDAAGIYQSATLPLAGGMKIDAGAHGAFVSANLTPDKETGLGSRTEGQVAAAIQTGHTRDRRLNYWAMPWQVYGTLSPDDAIAIARYLSTLEAVRNRIPEPVYYGSLETIARKLFYPWPAVPPMQLTYAAGNFGDTGEEAGGTSTQTWLLRAQRFLLVIALIAWWLRRRGAPDEQRHGGAALTGGLLLFVFAAAFAFVDRYPALGPLPPGPIIGSFAASIPAVTAEDPSASVRQQGRYLFAVSSCAFCHGGDGGGGNKLSWRAFGTVWSANLTPHPGGLEAWSDEDVLRALRSGVRPDGRQMHWQAMPWDSFSNYREEDLRSLLAYVRGLPPIDRKRHASLPPASEDCADYTFWLRDSGARGGCE